MTPSLILQIVWPASGILGALLTVWKRRGCWIAYFISNVAAVTLLLIEGIYIPIVQYAVFAAIGVLGWVKWGKGK